LKQGHIDMPDISSITAALGLIKSLSEGAIQLHKANKALEVSCLVSGLADLRMEVAKIQEEQISRDRRIRELEETLAFQGRLVRKNQYYFEVDDSGQLSGDPYCPQCWEVERKAVHVYVHLSDQERCPNCKTVFRGPTLRVS
jgi:hypothetical protein